MGTDPGGHTSTRSRQRPPRAITALLGCVAAALGSCGANPAEPVYLPADDDVVARIAEGSRAMASYDSLVERPERVVGQIFSDRESKTITLLAGGRVADLTALELEQLAAGLPAVKQRYGRAASRVRRVKRRLDAALLTDAEIAKTAGDERGFSEAWRSTVGAASRQLRDGAKTIAAYRGVVDDLRTLVGLGLDALRGASLPSYQRRSAALRTRFEALGARLDKFGGGIAEERIAESVNGKRITKLLERVNALAPNGWISQRINKETNGG